MSLNVKIRIHPEGEASRTPSPKGSRPRMLMCYLCGREFGSKSLPIHIPQCKKKWMAEEEKKPPNQRRPMPLPPEKEVPIKTDGIEAIDDFNQGASAAFMASLEECPHCKRKFVPKAFKHHQNACTAQNPAKPAGTGLIANSLSNRLVPGAIAGSKHGFASKDSKDMTVGIIVYMTCVWTEEQPPTVRRKFEQSRPVMRQKIMAAHAKMGGQSSRTEGFCDECGKKFDRPESKFCAQCGTKRQVL
ncbi:unnamed protein product [Sphagnum balticum]